MSIAILAIMLSACTPVHVVDKVKMTDWDYAIISLGSGATINKSEGVEFFTNGKSIDPEDIKPHQWVVVKKTQPDGWFEILSTKRDGNTFLGMVSEGEEACPDWAAGLYSKCKSISKEDIH